ncbi:hypothetical protein CEXT_101031 [Caerostris extrusa]|uniref:Uncharacterized protein n=1 Tax=Caerostris extrusa TaxID=172846 RepID=A0AAV4XG62_CAEEX|nr:hypothetical protein CEXT_101031 [Caerostris extrusa]
MHPGNIESVVTKDLVVTYIEAMDLVAPQIVVKELGIEFENMFVPNCVITPVDLCKSLSSSGASCVMPKL